MGAHGIPCPSCGGIFPLGALGAPVDCPYCAHRFELSAGAVAELERYQAEVHAALGHAQVEQREIARWHKSTKSSESPWFGLLFTALSSRAGDTAGTTHTSCARLAPAPAAPPPALPAAPPVPLPALAPAPATIHPRPKRQTRF